MTLPLFAGAHGMRARQGFLLRYLCRFIFSAVPYPTEACEPILQGCEEGTPVYLFRGTSAFSAVYLNFVCLTLKLPLARVVAGVSFWPFAQLQQWFGYRSETQKAMAFAQAHYPNEKLSPQEAVLLHAVHAKQPIFIALKPPREGGSLEGEDWMRVLCLAQKNHAPRMFLFPHVVTDRTMSGSADKTITDLIFGHSRRAGSLRHMAVLASPLRRTVVRVAPALDLQALCEAHPNTDATFLARRARHEINRSMTDEERVIAGPELAPPDVTERHVLRDVLVRQAIESEVAQGKRSQKSIERHAAKSIRNIAARYNVTYIRVISQFLHLVFTRIYDGMAVDETGLMHVLNASRKGPVIFCPSHRSHVDYLVLSYVLWQHGITPPHIAAGANLSFFPLGTIFRNSGAFFLRRSFKDDPVYGAVFKAYVHELIKTGTSIEFFLEGTRSRTGKILMPKFGILSMIVDAWRRHARDDVHFVPVSIDYDRIIEAAAYHQELRGGEKQQENIGGLLKTTGVLRSRYGRVQVQFGEPISLAELAREHGLIQSDDPQYNDTFKYHVQRLGYQILQRVGTITSVTPSSVVATALMAHTGRAIAQGLLLARCYSILEFLERVQARLSESLTDTDVRASMLLEAVQKWVDEKHVVVEHIGPHSIEPMYRVPDEQRIFLDYHKNALMNYVAPVCLVARAMLKQHATEAPYEHVHRDTRFLSWVLKREFIYGSHQNFDASFQEAVEHLVHLQILSQHDAMLHLENKVHLEFFAGFLDSFVEGYTLTAQTLADLKAFPLWQKELVARTLEHMRRAFLEGTLSRPEAANRTLIESALAWLTDMRMVEPNAAKKGTLQLGPEANPEHLQHLIDAIGAFR